MRASEKGFTTIEILLVLLIITIIGAAGAVVYSNTKKDADTKNASTSAQKKDTSTKKIEEKTKPKTIETTMRETLDCTSEDTVISCELRDQTSTLAWVTKDDGYGGANYYLAQEDGDWKVIYSGNGEVPQATIDKYQIPEAWLGPQMDEVQ